MAHLDGYEVCSIHGDLDSSREPVYNGDNLCCQQLSSFSELSLSSELSRSSERVIMGPCTCRAPTESTVAMSDRMDLSFITGATVGTQGGSVHVGDPWEWDFLPGLTDLEVGTESVPSLHRWFRELQEPWSVFVATGSCRKTRPNSCGTLEVGTALWVSPEHS